MAAVTAISAEGRVRSMSDLLKRIANYFANEYDGDDKTAPKMELSVDELRYIASMNVDRCRAEAELRELKNKRYSRTNADRIRSMSDEELAEFLADSEIFSPCKNCDFHFVDAMNDDCKAPDGWICTKGYAAALIQKWLQSEVEE